MLSLLEVAACIPIVLFTWKIQGKAGQGISLRAGQKLPMESTALKAHSRREQPGRRHYRFTSVLLL